MKTLSICIPTYNRCDCLKQCLDSIVSQSVFSEIEVVVSDNASGDNTENLMKEYIDKYPNIIYSRNRENIGFDRNMLQVVSLAKGKYCLFIGDDDAFFPESLMHIMEILSSGTIEFAITNSWGYDIRLAKPVTLSPNLSITEDKSYNSLKDFIHSLQPDRIRTVGFFGGMSGQIFLRDFWNSLENKEQFIGTQTIHLYVLLHVMREVRFSLIANPTIMTRADNIRWDTFDMTSAWKREMHTKDGFLMIAKLYDIPYSSIELHIRFLASYCKNTLIRYIKRYILRDQETIVKIKSLLARLSGRAS